MNDAPPRPRPAVLVTGAAGRIGSHFATHSADRYDLRLMVQRESEATDALRDAGTIHEADLANLDRIAELCDGVDTVVPLAASPGPSPPRAELLPNNIVGTYHAMVAARRAGCRRVVFASSIHAVSGYDPRRQVHTDDTPNPGDLYGVTKCFGEALGRYMAEQEGLSVIAIRIGAFQPREKIDDSDEIAMIDAWVSQRDLTQLIQRCIDDNDHPFAIVHGLSDNRFNRMDITDTKARFGYAPDDDFTDANAALAPLELDDRVPDHDLSDPGQQSGIREELGQSSRVAGRAARGH